MYFVPQGQKAPASKLIFQLLLDCVEANTVEVPDYMREVRFATHSLNVYIYILPPSSTLLFC